MYLKKLTLLIALGALTGSLAAAQEALSDKRLDLAKQLLNNSDFPGQIMRAIGPQLSLGAGRGHPGGSPGVHRGRAGSSRADVGDAGREERTREVSKLFRHRDEPGRADAAAGSARRDQGDVG